MKRTNSKKLKRRNFSIFARNDSRFLSIHQQLMKLNIFNELIAFITKKYVRQDYFKVFEYASIHNISIKQACIIARLQGKNFPSPEQVMKCCRRSSPSK